MSAPPTTAEPETDGALVTLGGGGTIFPTEMLDAVVCPPGPEAVSVTRMNMFLSAATGVYEVPAAPLIALHPYAA